MPLIRFGELYLYYSLRQPRNIYVAVGVYAILYNTPLYNENSYLSCKLP